MTSDLFLLLIITKSIQQEYNVRGDFELSMLMTSGDPHLYTYQHMGVFSNLYVGRNEHDVVKCNLSLLLLFMIRAQAIRNCL